MYYGKLLYHVHAKLDLLLYLAGNEIVLLFMGHSLNNFYGAEQA